MKKVNFKKLAKKYKTPRQVQLFIDTFRYNPENDLKSAEKTILAKNAHCLEGAFVAAAILEQNGYPPLVVSIESIDNLDHVVYVFKHKNKWGSISQSSDPGLRGREPVFRSIRDLVWSYFDSYIDENGRITAYRLAHLDDSKSDWRTSKKNVYKAEKYLIKIKHTKIKSSMSSNARHKKMRQNHIDGIPVKPKKYWW